LYAILVPDKTTDETLATVQFFDNFVLRYGACHPMFFHGTLEEAVKESCNLPAKDVKKTWIIILRLSC